MTIAEGQAVVETARRYGRVYQTGMQRLSEANFTVANELLRTGRLGKVHTVPGSHRSLGRGRDADRLAAGTTSAVEGRSRLGRLAGSLSLAALQRRYCRGGWRGFYDFHTSCIGEWGAHTFPQCQVAIGAADTSAVEYNYVDNPYGDGMVTRFANGIQMILDRDAQKKYWHGSCGVRYEGTEGWVAIADGYARPEVSSPALLADFQKLLRDYMARTQRPMNHVRDFFNCIKSRRLTVANPVVMHRSMSTVHAANICMWLKREHEIRSGQGRIP